MNTATRKLAAGVYRCGDYTIGGYAEVIEGWTGRTLVDLHEAGEL